MIIFKKYQQADMVLGPTTITAERNQIVKFSEGLYRYDTCLLTTRGLSQNFYNDILSQFHSMDHLTYLALVISTLSVAVFIVIEKRINFFRAFWMVSKAFFYKRKL